MTSGIADALNFTGTLFLLRVHWFWMLVALGLGAWVGWFTAGEPPPPPPPETPPEEGRA